MALSLHSLRLKNPGAPVFVILHGLLGSSRNWMSIGKGLQGDFDVHALDLRNHGSSPHSESMDWMEMVADLKTFLDRNGIGKIMLMGHSLGGKLAMRFACEYSHMVEKLVIVDIAAKTYPPHHEAEFLAMKSIHVDRLASRAEAEQFLESLVPNWAMRRFLLTNLVRDPIAGTFKWQINLEYLHSSLSCICRNPLRETDRYEGPVLLMRGGASNFIEDEDVREMIHYFPRLFEMVIPEVGHNVHAEDRRGFLEILNGWL